MVRGYKEELEALLVGVLRSRLMGRSFATSVLLSSWSATTTTPRWRRLAIPIKMRSW